MRKKRIDLGLGIVAEVKKNWKINSKIILGLIGDIVATMFLTWQTFLMNTELPQEVFWMILSLALRPYIMSMIILIFKGARADLEGLIIQQESENVRLRDISELQVELAAAKPERIEAIKESIHGVTSWNIANRQMAHLQKIEKILDDLLKTKKVEEGEVK
jgi:hypothetical protein